MKQNLLNKIACTSCRGNDFKLEVFTENKDEIRSGKITCKKCNKIFSIEDGILNLNVLSEAEKREQAGWAEMAKREEWYSYAEKFITQLPDPVGLKTPEVNWPRHSRNFKMLLEKLGDLRGKDILDVGAGRCWSTRFFSAKGANAVALDILTDKYIGLGASDILMRRYKTYFDRVAGNMNHFPFNDASFDIVFITGSLHHTNNLLQTIRELKRLLRPGGILALTNEACGGFFSDELIDKPTDLGINEHNYKYIRYIYYLKKCGFKITPYQEAGTLKSLASFYELKKYLRGGVLILTARN